MKHQQENRAALTKYESIDSNDTKSAIDFISNDQQKLSPLVLVEQQQTSIVTINVPTSEMSNIMLSDVDLVWWHIL